MDDPFRHHPGLRGLIADPLASFFRDFDLAEMDRRQAERGAPPGWRLPDAVREAGRLRALAGRRDADLWVFAYGSLMWDPAILFEEVRRARVPGFARRFILRDTLGGRGTPEEPGIMAALDPAEGKACEGLVFRIARHRIDDETERLWRRERIVPAYVETFVTAETEQGPLEAVAFVADHGAEMIRADLSWQDQVRFCATGTGFLGSSLDYARNLAAHFAELRIHDPDLDRLLADAESLAARNGEAAR